MEITSNRKFGLKIPDIKKEDYKFGASLPFIVYQPNGQWDAYLPRFEEQSKIKGDSFSCTSFGTLNCVETLIKRMYNE